MAAGCAGAAAGADCSRLPSDVFGTLGGVGSTRVTGGISGGGMTRVTGAVVSGGVGSTRATGAAVSGGVGMNRVTGAAVSGAACGICAAIGGGVRLGFPVSIANGFTEGPASKTGGSETPAAVFFYMVAAASPLRMSTT